MKMKMNPDERAALSDFWRNEGAVMGRTGGPLNAQEEAELVVGVYRRGKKATYALLTNLLAQVVAADIGGIAVEILAAELHRQYRAAEKALNPYHIHDHGWQACGKKKYFLQRAAMIIKRAKCTDPQTLGEAEQSLAALVLLRRLMVTGSI